MRGKATLLAVLVISLVTAPAAAAVGGAVMADMTGPSAINEQADAAHNPYIDTDTTISSWQMGWGHTNYEDNSGEVAELPATVNSSVANPAHYQPTDLNTSAYGEFPRKSEESGDNEASALDASEWSTDATGSAGSVSVNDVTTAPNVDAVEVTASSQSAGDNALATYDNFTISSDGDKRYFSLVLDVDSIDAGAEVNVMANDSDGDYVVAHIDPDDDASTGNVIANESGEGYIFQQRVGDMATKGNGDGSIDEITELTVGVQDGNADVEIAAVNLEANSPWDFGDRRADWDSDDSNETEAVHQWNQSEALALTDMNTVDTAFDDGEVRDLTVPMQFKSSLQSEADDYERWNVSYEDAEEFAAYDTRINDYRRLHLESAYDLSYADAELRDTVEVPSSRYQTVEYATGVGTTNFSEISYTDATSSYGSLGDDVTVATGLSAGDQVALHYDYVATSEEVENMRATGGGGAPMQGGSGGFLGGIWGQIASVGGSILVFLGLRKRAGGN
jgi:hypothetical protein